MLRGEIRLSHERWLDSPPNGANHQIDAIPSWARRPRPTRRPRLVSGRPAATGQRGVVIVLAHGSAGRWWDCRYG